MSPIHIFRHLATAAAIACATAGSGAAAPRCEPLAASAAARHGIPGGLMTAIAHTESGRTADGEARAWPWTANVRGKGYYFDSREAALRHLRPLVAAGERDFDVGCMQLSYRWHGENFSDLEQMIDPERNTDYAARYLAQLRAETGDWDGATRYYHSRDAVRGAAYLGRVRRALARTAPDAASVQGARVAVQESPARIPNPKNAGHVPRDMRFAKGAALVVLNRTSSYWAGLALPEGAHPVMPAE